MGPSSNIQTRAVESLFEVFEEMCEGAISVDRQSRIVWINEKYRVLLGLGDDEDILGRDIEEVIPESLMRQVVESGTPVPVDIMSFGERHFVVSRLPLYDDASRIIGAVGFVLFDSLDYLEPLISKFESMQTRLTSAEAELAAERRTRHSIANFIGISPQMVEIRRLARRMSQVNSPVLVLGETGTGKELLAQSIHAASQRSNRPFVAVNMAAIPESLLESEFFGVAPGAYTGAERQHREGKFDIANGGTLFLDEIGDMPVALQAKLLRVLEEQCFEPVGSNEVRQIDVRVIAATSQDILAKLESGRFRRDLFYRLNVLPVQIPPLRERLMDLRPIAEVLLEKITQTNGTTVRELDSGALLLLQQHTWPGNVRELRNILERACLVSGAGVLTADVFEQLLPAGTGTSGPAKPRPAQGGHSLPQRVANLEREAIIDALASTAGKKAPAARLLGISRSTLYEKIQEYNLSDIRS